MKKTILGFTLRLCVLLLAFALAARIFLEWTGYFENTTFVAYLYQDTAFNRIEIDQMTALFDTEEVPFESASIYGSAAERTAKMIEKGANTIILNLADAPTDDLFALAKDNDVTLFFVGSLPTKAQCSSYDKVWCFTESTAYAGELLGEQIALGVRNDVIADANEDILLDYLFFNADETYMPTEPAMETTLLELDHYGIYTTDVYAAAYSVALAAAEQEAENAALAAEQALEETDTATEADSPEETDTPTPEAGTEADTAEDVLDVTVAFSDLAVPEVALSIGSANATYLANQATLLGWRSDTTPTAIGCIVENYVCAQKLAETGMYHSIVYFDTIAATNAVVTMASNAWAQTPVTNGTDFAPTDDKTFVIEHQIYPMD